MNTDLEIKFASIDDVPLILRFIKEFAEYSRLLDQVTVTEDILRDKLFGEKKYAEVIIAYVNNLPVGFTVFFYNFSTFLGKPGIYLEDLYIIPDMRGMGIATKIFSFLAKLAIERNCGRLEWRVLDWNKSAVNLYKKIGAIPMDEWTVQRVAGQALIDLASHYSI